MVEVVDRHWVKPIKVIDDAGIEINSYRNIFFFLICLLLTRNLGKEQNFRNWKLEMKILSVGILSQLQ